MRIVIDMQGAQGSGRFRGIGRYTLALADGLIRSGSGHEIILALNGLFPESVDWLKQHFHGKVPQENILVWAAPGPVDFSNEANVWRRLAAELLREAFFQKLNPDVVVVGTMIEGIGDNSVTSIGRFTGEIKYAVVVHDLIPLLNQEFYLPTPLIRRWYMEKLMHLKKADILLANSDASRTEAIEHAHIPPEKIFTISAAADPKFHVRNMDDDFVQDMLKRINITRPFVLYCGASDVRKNLPRLISAYAALPKKLREANQLLLAGTMPPNEIAALQEHARKVGLAPDEMVISGYLNDESIIFLYQSCRCFVIPSWHEGFGLPALEAMSCGAPVIGSNTSSLPEVIGNSEALFDPFSEKSISEKLAQVLTNEDFRQDLIRMGLAQAKTFSWDATAERALAALESLIKPRHTPAPETGATVRSLIQAVTKLPGSPNDQRDLLQLAATIDYSFPEARSS